VRSIGHALARSEDETEGVGVLFPPPCADFAKLNRRALLKDGVDDDLSLYVDDADVTSPYLSPLYGDFANAFPPTYLRSGTRDLLLSDTVRMHAALRKARVDAYLYVGEAMPHSGFPDDTPEQTGAIADTVRWLGGTWST
jgi:acetyl esterase/lipase